MQQQREYRPRSGRPKKGEAREPKKQLGVSIRLPVAEAIEQDAEQERRSVSSIVAEIVERAYSDRVPAAA